MLNVEDRNFINYLYNELEYVYSKMNAGGKRLKKEGRAIFSDVKSILKLIGKSDFLANKTPENQYIGLNNLNYVTEEDVDIFKFISILNIIDKLAHIFENRNTGFDFTRKFYSIKNAILDYVLERYPSNAFCIQTREDGTVNHKNAPYHIVFMVEDTFFSYHTKYQLSDYDNSNHRIAYIRFLKMLKKDKIYDYASMDIEDIVALANHQLKEMQLEDKRFKNGSVNSYKYISYVRPNRRIRKPFNNEQSTKEWMDLYSKKSPRAKAELRFVYDIFNISVPENIRYKIHSIFAMFILKGDTLKSKDAIEKFINETILSNVGTSEEEIQYSKKIRETARRFAINLAKYPEMVFEGGASYDSSKKQEEKSKCEGKKIDANEFGDNLKQTLLNCIKDKQVRERIDKLLVSAKGIKIKGIALEKLVDMEILQTGSEFISPEMLDKAQRIILTGMMQQSSSKERDLFEVKNTKSGKIYLLVHLQANRAKPFIYEISSNIRELCKLAGVNIIQGNKSANCNLDVLEKVILENERKLEIKASRIIYKEELDKYISGIVVSRELDRIWQEMDPEDKFGILSIVRQYMSVELFKESLNRMNDKDKVAVMRIINKYTKPRNERSGPSK